jgi:hypothetical protein
MQLLPSTAYLGGRRLKCLVSNIEIGRSGQM